MNWKHVCFVPWQGKGFGKANPYGLPERLLLLGEAHYGTDAERADRQLTRRVVGEAAEGGRKHSFFPKTVRALAGQLSTADVADFWQHVAFANYVQEIVAPKPRVAPKPASFQEARPAFWEMLEKLQPTHVVVLGFRLWSHMPPFDGARPDGAPISAATAASTYGAYCGGRVHAIGIRHPSSAFSPPAWHKLLRLFFRRTAVKGSH